MDGFAGEAPNLKLLLSRWVERCGQRRSEDRPCLLAEDFPNIEFIGLVRSAQAEENHLARLNTRRGRGILRSLLMQGDSSVRREPY